MTFEFNVLVVIPSVMAYVFSFFVFEVEKRYCREKVTSEKHKIIYIHHNI